MNVRNIVKHSAFPLVVLGALAIVLFANLAVAVAHNHHEYVYDQNGWSEVAASSGGKFTWAIDPNFPTTMNNNSYNIRNAMRYAMNKWALLRSGSTSRGYAREISSYSSADYQYEECEGETDCYGSNLKQFHDEATSCDSHHNHWGMDGHGPICYAFSRLDPDWNPPSGIISFRGAIAHEMGHALGLQHPSWPDCDTIMNSCWIYQDVPGVMDHKSLDKMYGLPYEPSLSLVSGTTIRASAKDYSSHDENYRFELWRKPNGSSAWISIHSRTVTAPSGVGGTVSYSENVSTHGCGDYIYGIHAVNEYPDDTDAEQFGGYTNAIYVCEVP